MYTEVLRAISGVAIYPVVSLLLFVLTFGVVLIWVARLDRGRLDRLARLPLDDDGASAGKSRTRPTDVASGFSRTRPDKGVHP